jgi:glycosyltransferase involved in cell wall biosynthesis
MTSKIEGMPISLIEALACGLIPICTAVGGIVDMVDDGNTGFLSYDLTTESYIKAIERFLALSDNEIESMKRKCKDASQQYTIERCAAQYEILFSK